ncbi:uncharacterized protein [Amphiura filiformis]|uniref:uncharacterized protein n=1 Tax=Amphiura filiformis TaxID=82378 RepID=UPI003B228D3A
MKISLTLFMGSMVLSMVAGYLTDATSKKTNEEAFNAQAMKRQMPYSGWPGVNRVCDAERQQYHFDNVCRVFARDMLDALDFLKLRDVAKRRASFNSVKEDINEECCYESCAVQEIVELC